MVKGKTKTEPRYSFFLRYKEDTEKDLQKIQKDRNIKVRNDAIILAIKIVAGNNLKQ